MGAGRWAVAVVLLGAVSPNAVEGFVRDGLLLHPLGRRSALEGQSRLTVVMRGGKAKMSTTAGDETGPWATYMKLLDKYPLRTKMVTSAVLATLGDVIAQKLIERASGYAFRRLLLLLCVNVLYIAPVLHVWYGLFEHLVTNVWKLKGGTLKSMVALVCLDQLLNAPLTIIGFFTSYAFLDVLFDRIVGGGAAFTSVGPAIRAKVAAEYVSTLLANWKVWVIPQCLNFKVVPPPLRVTFANLVAVVWNTILSIVANR